MWSTPMAVSGKWKERQAGRYANATVWGTGWNPVHAIRSSEGRDIAPDGIYAPVPEQFEDPYTDDNYGYQSEDQSSVLWGYGPETGTSDRPGLDVPFDRDSTDGFPAYAPPYRSGIPRGTVIRSQDHGAEASYTAKATMPDAAQGHAQKLNIFGGIADAQVSDPAQYEMQTSMTQMSKSRTGSQRGGGSASEYDAPIPGTRRTMGQRAYVPSDSEERRAEMFPQQQDLILRPFQYRTAGTGNPEWMQPNEMYLSEPLQRVPSPDPFGGTEVPYGDVPGFVDEGWSVG